MSVGNINAISDWINSKYSLSNKEKAMMTYFTKYTITFSGASNEIITVVNSALSLDYGYIQLDSDGIAQREMYFLPGDVVTFNGSQSNYNKEYTFGFDTTPLIRVMPDGAIFWYGNQCTDMTEGWSLKGIQDAEPTNATVDFSNRQLTIEKMSNSQIILTTNKKIDLSIYNKMLIHTKSLTVTNRPRIYSADYYDIIIDDYYSISGRSGKSFYPLWYQQSHNSGHNVSTTTTQTTWNSNPLPWTNDFYINPNALTVANVMLSLTIYDTQGDIFTIKVDQIVLKNEQE